jgi:valyl-tRNA synthetase
VFRKGDARAKAQVLKIMHHVFATALRLLHPLMPFVTEELWHTMQYDALPIADRRSPVGGRGDGFIAAAAWPTAVSDERVKAWGIGEALVTYVDNKHELIRLGRAMKLDYGIAPSKAVDYIVKPDSPGAGALLADDVESIQAFLRADSLTLDPGFEPDTAMASGVGKLGTIYMPVKGLVDAESETARLTGQLEKVEGNLERVNRKLENVDFVSKAPDTVVERQRTMKQDLLEKRDKLKGLIHTLSEL